MISKRTAVILIIAIIAIVIFETQIGFDRMKEIEDNLEHTVAQVTLRADGEITDLKGLKTTYEYSGAQTAETALFGAVNEKGYENTANNSVSFKSCAKGRNKLTFTIPKELLPVYSSDITVSFGYEHNTSDFNNYSLILDLTTIDENSVKCDLIQTVYYPNENGETKNKKADFSTVINSSDSVVNCIID